MLILFFTILLACKIYIISMNNPKVEEDVKNNKVKQGLLLKQSRHLKEWKERWIVLTKTHLYSFPQKGQYKNATQIIMLKDIQTLKSYYKDQYKPYTFRVESPSVNLHMSTKSCDEKWAWMTAIQRMIEKELHPDLKADTHNMIRQTLKMSTAFRQTIMKKQDKSKQNTDLPDALFKKLKLNIYNNTNQLQINPLTVTTHVLQNKLSEEEETFFVLSTKNAKNQQTESNSNQIKMEQQKVNSVLTQEQKKVETPANDVKVVQKIVQVEKIVRVPQIREKIVQKIVERIVQKVVYKQSPSKQANKLLPQTLKQLMLNPGENPTPLVNFVVYLMTCNSYKYQSQVLQFCLDMQSRRFFSEIFLLMLNEQINEQMLNKYLKFVLFLYESCDQYFYASDTKVLISLLIRQLQMNRSQFHQSLILMIFASLVDKQWWASLNYRRDQIQMYVKQIEAVGGAESQLLASQLLPKI